MHDTLAYRKKFFQRPERAIGHECVRMEKPLEFAEALLAADKGWSANQVKALWDNAVNKPVSIEHQIPVHMVYFTAVVDDAGKVSSFADLYGLDNKMAAAMFGQRGRLPYATAREQVVRGGSRGARVGAVAREPDNAVA